MVDDQSGSGQMGELDGQLREDALDVLVDASTWQLAGPRWDAVAAAIGALAVALRSADVRGVRTAVYDLELAGPPRATGVGDTPVVPAPEPVREEINELIHTLDGRSAAE